MAVVARSIPLLYAAVIYLATGSYNIKLELCRAHTPRAHCTIYRFTFVHMAMNFREMLLSCNILNGPSADRTMITLSAPDLDY